ncbi:YceI family protein [Winogradskyella pulchriflava]|uniref:YceI family protein n=1 Tax=Winogradskyella pulchriflava TaxID=1110688 RepID=A0ABV6QB43_9FLAO
MMKSIKFPILFLAVLLSGFYSLQVTSQSFILNKSNSTLEVHGTSSLHDWHLETEKQSGEIVITNSDDLAISTLNFSVETESLKSGKSSMDKNTYKALKTDDYKTIDFKFKSIKQVNKLENNSFKATIIGDLTISGVTKSISLDITLNLNGTKVLLEGEKSLKMTDYGIDPPKALLGTIKTGDAIKIIFKSEFESK